MNGAIQRPVRWAARFVALLALIVCLVPACRAAEVPPPPSAAVALSYRAEGLQKALLSGDADKIQAAVQEVELLRRNYGTLDLLPLVEAMALWARQQGEAGQPELGLKAIQVADRWAPRCPTVLCTSIILQRQEGIKGYFMSLSEVVELTRLRMTHPIHRWLWLVQHLAWLRFMATALLWGWALAMAMRYRRVFRYTWEEPLLKRGLPSLPVALIGACLLAFPVLVGLDPSLCAALWLWFLAPYFTIQEVRVGVVVLVLQLLHPALAAMEPLSHQEPQRSIVSLQTQPLPRPISERILKALPEGDVAFLNGWALLQEQKWGEAELVFASLGGKHPARAEVINNQGVACYQQGKFEEARGLFEQAYRLSPLSPEVLFNQSVIAFRQLDSSTGLAKQDEARRLDPDNFLRMNLASQARSEQRTFAMPLPDSPERMAALRGRNAAPDPDPGIGPHLIFAAIYPILALLALLWRVRQSVRKAHPSQCTRCGDPFHTTDSPDVFVCSKCHHLFVLKDGLHGESRKLKVEEVATYQGAQRILHRTLRILLPGLDAVLLGATGSGFAEFSFLTFALGIVFATGRSVRFPGEILPDPVSSWVPLGFALLVVLYLRSWFKFLPSKRS
ncbi:MAG: hypothetical protein H6Q00_1533 [Holophagaceae bacterium]|nr:hypothetical protein [Holophagaceae bacterium]